MLSLAVGPAAVLARIIRVEMVAVLQADYVRTARAKRLPARGDLPASRVAERAHQLDHPRRVAAQLGMVAGTVLVENVFAWPGLGSTIVQSILSKDYPVVQAVVLVYGIGRARGEPGRRCRAGPARPPFNDPGELS